MWIGLINEQIIVLVGGILETIDVNPRSRGYLSVRWSSEQEKHEQPDRKQNGMRGNPLEEDVVFKPEQYVYSSAIDYAGEKVCWI